MRRHHPHPDQAPLPFAPEPPPYGVLSEGAPPELRRLWEAVETNRDGIRKALNQMSLGLGDTLETIDLAMKLIGEMKELDPLTLARRLNELHIPATNPRLPHIARFALFEVHRALKNVDMDTQWPN